MDSYEKNLDGYFAEIMQDNADDCDEEVENTIRRYIAYFAITREISYRCLRAVGNISGNLENPPVKFLAQLH